MKKALTILMLALAGFILAGLAVVGCARAASIKLAWDANPAAEQVTDYRIWRGIDCLATVSGTAATVTVPDALPSNLTVTARNAAGLESAHSAAVSIPAPNATRLTLQASTDLQTWQDIATYYDARQPAVFYRLKVEVQP